MNAALMKRMRVVYRLLAVALVGIISFAIAAPAYAATGGHPHIYTIGRQSTLTGAVIILVICAVSIRRNLRRSAHIKPIEGEP